MPKTTTVPAALKPFLFHGLVLDYESKEQATGDCPFCARDGKFYASVNTGLWDCKVCEASGNALSFLRQLWEASEGSTRQDELEALARDRGYLTTDGLAAFGVRQSVSGSGWLVPGYDATGSIYQVYKYVSIKHKDRWVKRLLPTPGVWPDGKVHGLFGSFPLSKKGDKVYICEGPWDGIALWEVMSEDVVAAPGCNVFKSSWLPLAAGRSVTVIYDSDFPRQVGQKRSSAGFDGMKRVCGALLAVVSTDAPKDVSYLCWGKEGYDPKLPDGHDVRDFLKIGRTLEGRKKLAAALMEKTKPAPQSWKEKAADDGGSKALILEPARCESWPDLLSSWRQSMRMRQCLEDVLAVMLAVALSTEQVGDQLFLQVIGDAGSGKTRFCDGMLVSKNCFSLEHLTGFHSGWKDNSGDDFSLLSRINRKTLITPEGDVLMSSPRFVEIMSQQRRIFDGASGASYKNRKEDLRYTGLRTPWIMAGTPELLESDQSRLGDRFLRVHIDKPSRDERGQILMKIGYTALRAVMQTSNCAADSQNEESLTHSYRLTGGYVDYLRQNAARLLSAVSIPDQDRIIRDCTTLAEFTADFRARPHPDHKKEALATKELPTRLTHQFVRLAVCLAATLGRSAVDDEVMRVVRKVAIDTACGWTLEIAKRVTGRLKTAPESDGMTQNELSILLGLSTERTGELLLFLSQIGVVRSVATKGGPGVVRRSSRPTWRLTLRAEYLYKKVMVE